MMTVETLILVLTVLATAVLAASAAIQFSQPSARWPTFENASSSLMLIGSFSIPGGALRRTMLTE